MVAATAQALRASSASTSAKGSRHEGPKVGIQSREETERQASKTGPLAHADCQSGAELAEPGRLASLSPGRELRWPAVRRTGGKSPAATPIEGAATARAAA